MANRMRLTLTVLLSVFVAGLRNFAIAKPAPQFGGAAFGSGSSTGFHHRESTSYQANNYNYNSGFGGGYGPQAIGYGAGGYPMVGGYGFGGGPYGGAFGIGK